MRVLVLLLSLAPAFATAHDCAFTAQRDFDVDAAALKTLALDLSSNDVVVEGVPGLAKVEVRGKACASEESRLAGLVIDQQRSGDRLTLTPRRPDQGANWVSSSYAYIDLTLRVPTSIAVDIKSGSGDVEVSGVAALDYRAGSGDLKAHRIEGALVVKVGSGNVTGDRVGSVDVRGTSSGDIQLRDVRGDASVASAGSGDLTFDEVGGKVTIGSVGSGDVEVSRTRGDVRIDSIGSGDVNVNVVGGNFTVGSKGSGDIAHRQVSGTVSVPRADD